jgi:hypothetical protein
MVFTYCWFCVYGLYLSSCTPSRKHRLVCVPFGVSGSFLTATAEREAGSPKYQPDENEKLVALTVSPISRSRFNPVSLTSHRLRYAESTCDSYISLLINQYINYAARN